MNKILCIAQVEDRANLDKQIAKQTIQPDRVIFYVDEAPARGIDARRKRIAENHKRLQDIVMAYKPEFIWQVEQDGDYPEDCLEKLIMDYDFLNKYDFLNDNDNIAYVSGIQVGRHGLYCLGAWRNFTDDSFESLDHTSIGLQEVEATGFYCIYATYDKWMSGKCDWNGEPYGPDVVWSLSIKGKKYCDMSLTIGHIVNRGIIRPEHTSTCNARFYLEDNRWKFKQL